MNMNSAADSEGFPLLFCNAERPSRAISYAFPFRPSSRKIYRETDNRLSTWETTGLCRRSRPRHRDAGAEDSCRRRRLRMKRMSFFYPSVVALSLFHLQMSSFISSVVTLSLFYLQSFPSIPLLLLYLFFNCNCFFFIPSVVALSLFHLQMSSFISSAVAPSLFHLQLFSSIPLLLHYPSFICNCLFYSLCCCPIPFPFVTVIFYPSAVALSLFSMCASSMSHSLYDYSTHRMDRHVRTQSLTYMCAHQNKPTHVYTRTPKTWFLILFFSPQHFRWPSACVM